MRVLWPGYSGLNIGLHYIGHPTVPEAAASPIATRQQVALRTVFQGIRRRGDLRKLSSEVNVGQEKREQRLSHAAQCLCMLMI